MGNFCQTCGARRNPEARFCTSCGAASGAQVADHASYAPPRRPWGLWLAGAGGALALVAGVAVATGQGLPFGEHSADTDGDGVVSESELRAELAAMPPFEPGQWQIIVEESEGLREPPKTKSDVVEMTPEQSDDLIEEIILGGMANIRDGALKEISHRCLISSASLIGANYHISGTCRSNDSSGDEHESVTEIIIKGQKDKSSISAKAEFKRIYNGEIKARFYSITVTKM